MCRLAFDEFGEDYPECGKASFLQHLVGNDICPNAIPATRKIIGELKRNSKVAICGGNP
jgi:hypothetical protein